MTRRAPPVVFAPIALAAFGGLGVLGVYMTTAYHTATPAFLLGAIAGLVGTLLGILVITVLAVCWAYSR